MIALLSYLGSHWSLFLVVVLAVVALGFLAWFTKNLKFILGAVALVIAGLAYQSSNIDGYKRKAAEDAQAQVQALQKRLLTVSMMSYEDTRRATADAYLNSQLDALTRATPYNAGACLDLPAARRVRAIGDGRNPDTHTAPLPARRLTSLLQRRSAAP